MLDWSDCFIETDKSYWPLSVIVARMLIKSYNTWLVCAHIEFCLGLFHSDKRNIGRSQNSISLQFFCGQLPLIQLRSWRSTGRVLGQNNSCISWFRQIKHDLKKLDLTLNENIHWKDKNEKCRRMKWWWWYWVVGKVLAVFRYWLYFHFLLSLFLFFTDFIFIFSSTITNQ